MNKFSQILSKNEVIFADGAIGINLFEKGLETGYPPELWNVENPKQITSLHREFIKDSSELIPIYDNGQICYKGSLKLMADYAVLVRDLGVKIIGGCCGYYPNSC
jgi:5-methyltetrahydrofolate--homocysteine methyltransferase